MRNPQFSPWLSAPALIRTFVLLVIALRAQEAMLVPDKSQYRLSRRSRLQPKLESPTDA
jgi:hypothetical protein